MEYPKTLYVNEQQNGYLLGVKVLVGSGHLERMVQEGKETEVAVYQLVGVKTYKKTIKIESTIEKMLEIA